MPEISIAIRGYNVLTIRIDPTEITGQGSAAHPILNFPLKVQMMPINSQQGEVHYQLLRLAGTLHCGSLAQFAQFELGPLLHQSDPSGNYFQQVDGMLVLDHARIKQFEDARAGNDAQFSMSFSGLIWFPGQKEFEKINGPVFQVSVPRSRWIDVVISRWGLSRVKIVEIKFPANQAGDNLSAAYARVEAAEKLYLNGLWKQSLAELYSAFEDLAKSLGFAKPDQQFFVSLLAESHPVKKEKAKLTLDYICGFFQLGRHEPGGEPPSANSPFLLRRDARFGLTLAHALFEYLTPEG